MKFSGDVKLINTIKLTINKVDETKQMSYGVGKATEGLKNEL